MCPSLTFIQAAGTVAVCEVGLCLDSHRTGGSNTAEAGPFAEEGAGNREQCEAAMAAGAVFDPDVFK